MGAEQEHVQTMLERLACFVHSVCTRHGNAGEIGVWQTSQGGFEGAWCRRASRRALPCCGVRRAVAWRNASAATVGVSACTQTSRSLAPPASPSAVSSPACCRRALLWGVPIITAALHARQALQRV